MPLDLMELARTDFRTSKQADDINSRFQTLLGLPHRYGPARLAIGTSLSLDGEPVFDATLFEDAGKPIKGENLFGTGADLATWVSLIVERDFTPAITKRDFQQAVAFHWDRGIKLLWEQWKALGNDFDRFLVHVMEKAGLAKEGGANTTDISESPAQPDAAVPIDLSLGDPGTDLSSGEKIQWRLNGKGASPHVAIMGTLGTGKTQLANMMLAQISKASPPTAFLVFDMGKGDLARNQDLIASLQATVVSCPAKPVPLDVLHVADHSENALLDAARRFRDSFVRAATTKIGAKQGDALREAAISALRKKGSVSLGDIRKSLKAVYEELKRNDDAVTAMFNELCDYKLFGTAFTPSEFFRKSWIVDVHEADEMSQRFIVYLILDAIDTYLTRLPDAAIDKTGNRAIRLVVMIDEARKVLGSGQPSLVNIVRTSRSKGAAVMFVTQSPDDFAQEDEDFLENIGMPICFRTNSRNNALKNLLGSTVDLPGLPNGVCVTRLAGKGKPTRVQVWS